MSNDSITAKSMRLIGLIYELMDAARGDRESEYRRIASLIDKIAFALGRTQPNSMYEYKVFARAAAALWTGPANDIFEGVGDDTLARVLINNLAFSEVSRPTADLFKGPA
jgi:hypothetical protein